MKTIKPNNINQKKLRALAPRAVRVVERNQAAVPTVAELGRVLIPAADEYAATYDALVKRRHTRAETAARAEQVVSNLRREVATIGVLVRARLPELDAHDLERPTETADGVLAAADRLLEVLTVSVATTPSLDGFMVTLRAATDAARTTVDANERARVEQQMAQAETRERGVTVHGHLRALRRLLRLELGTRHHDYQGLRTLRRNAETTEDEVLVDETEPEETALPVVTATPSAFMNGAHA